MNAIILFVDMDREWAKSLLLEELAKADREILFFHEPLNVVLDKLGSRSHQIEILSNFIFSSLGDAEFARMSSLRLVTTRATGFDHINLQQAAKHQIMVCNVPTYGDNTVAEHTFALILSLSRKLRETYERVRRNEFNIIKIEGFDLRGKTLGVIGTGHIGLRVIQIARGFNMQVHAYDVKEQPLLADVLGFSYASLDEVLSTSDIVTLHAPLTPHTYHLIDAQALAKMKPGALLINTARGALVDTDALHEALRTGHLGGAGLDVLEHEAMLLDEDHSRAGLHDGETRTLLLNHLLLHRDNVIFTPHVAFNSREANERIFRTTAQNILSYLDGHPQNIVIPAPQASKQQ